MTPGVGTTVAGRYRIERLLGEGGMGTVFEATNLKLQKRVALKVLNEQAPRELAERFQREAIAASKVHHPGIVVIYDADVDDGLPWIAMELLEGESLRDRMARDRPPQGEALDLVEEALDALAAVHDAGIVHRDLKPDNLFLERLAAGRRVKILDFGIAKVRVDQLGSTTATHTAMGTPHYLAPEQATSAKVAGPTADVYGMGVVLFELLGGALPYAADSFGELVRQMFTSGPRALSSVAPHVPAPLARVVDRCLRVDPESRFEHARALRDAIRAARAELARGEAREESREKSKGEAGPARVEEDPKAGARDEEARDLPRAEKHAGPSEASPEAPDGGARGAEHDGEAPDGGARGAEHDGEARGAEHGGSQGTSPEARDEASEVGSAASEQATSPPEAHEQGRPDEPARPRGAAATHAPRSAIAPTSKKKKKGKKKKPRTAVGPASSSPAPLARTVVMAKTDAPGAPWTDRASDGEDPTFGRAVLAVVSVIGAVAVGAWIVSGLGDDSTGEVEPSVEAAVAPVEAPRPPGQAPERFAVRLDTTEGPIDVDVTRAWAPHGADRFYALVREGFFTDVAFFRVIAGFMAQFGLHGDPRVDARWRDRRIPDDPPRQSNTRGMVSFAMAGPGSRTTQLFINFGDNSRLDASGFAPFGRVRDMSAVDRLYAGYGEGAPGGRGPDQRRIGDEGNTYLRAQFPELDYIRGARLLD